MDLSRKKRTRVYTEVVEQIRKLIADGVLAPGDQLLPERQLAEKLGVSRTAVREALTALVSLGFLEITPGSGAYVKEVRIDDLIDPLATIMLKERKNVFDLLEARMILETGTARLAALRAQRTDLYELNELTHEMDMDVTEGRNTDESDSQFHFCVARASYNPVLVNLMTVLMDMMRACYSPARKKLVEREDERDMWFKQHYRVYEAIKARDPEAAAAAMSDHLESTIRELRELQDWEENQTSPGEAGGVPAG